MSHSGGRSKRVKSSRTALVTNWVWSQSVRLYLRNKPVKQAKTPKTATKGSYFLVFLMQAPSGSSRWNATGLEDDFEQCLRNTELGQCLNPQTQMLGHVWTSESLRMPCCHCFPETCALNFVILILKGRTMRTKARLGGPGRNKKR